MRKEAKLRQDENAIGHTFQATRRAINAELESARASGKADDVQRVKDRLQEAQRTADSARKQLPPETARRYNDSSRISGRPAERRRRASPGCRRLVCVGPIRGVVECSISTGY